MSVNSQSQDFIQKNPSKTALDFFTSEEETSNRSQPVKKNIPYIPLWKNRTSEINESISKAFQAIACDTQSEWGLYNGNSKYHVGGVKEHKLMKILIQKAPAERKDFYALDIGAGNYQWGRKLAEYLNAKKDIPKEVNIHIIGIRGEKNFDKVVTELGQCKLYEFGEFQVERLMDEFEQRGLQLVNKVDLIVSRWCFRHLVDPVGTFAQAHDLLRPKTGHLLIDGFFFLYEDEKMEGFSANSNTRMTQLCLEIDAPFLTYYYETGRSLNHFVINKPDDHPCPLQKHYLGIEKTRGGWQIGSETVTRFKEPENTDTEDSLLHKGDYRGDKELYERLRQNGLLENSNLVWGPLQEKDTHKQMPPLHRAIVSKDEEGINRCLQEGCDINESDGMGSGFTPLHLAIKYKNLNLCSLLLKRGAQTTLFADRCTPLHLAVKYDFEGCFIEALIQASANINKKIKCFNGPMFTPLELAIEHKNVKAVELLLKAKAIIDYKNRQLLENNPTFSSVQHLLPKKFSQLEGSQTIIDHIRKGDCVILAYPNKFFCYKFQKSMQLEENSKVILVTVNPDTRLLDDKNYLEIKEMINCKVGDFFFEEDINNAPHLKLKLGY